MGYLYCIGNPRTDWLYQTEAAEGLKGRSLRYSRGKALGGCSSINAMIYMRGQSRDYEHWAEVTGDEAWRWQPCLADFKAHENHHKLDATLPPDFARQHGGTRGDFAQLHGHGGEWRIEKQRLRWEVLDAFAEPWHSFPAITASVCNLNPTSRGRVEIKTPHFEDAPAIAPNYLATDADRKVAADSLRVTRRIMAQPAMAPFAPEEFKPGMQYQSDEELAKRAGDIASTIFHPVGTTRMGRGDDPMAVVNSRLQVRGVAGLRVVDAGVMPTITSGNTNSPTLMIAEKAARWIAEDAAR